MRAAALDYGAQLKDLADRLQKHHQWQRKGRGGRGAGQSPPTSFSWRHQAGSLRHRYHSGQSRLLGTMLESFLVEGRQDLDSAQPLVYGQSITDGCIGWETTEQLLIMFAEAVRHHRANVGSPVSHGLAAANTPAPCVNPC